METAALPASAIHARRNHRVCRCSTAISRLSASASPYARHKKTVRVPLSATHRRPVSPARQGRWKRSHAHRLSANPNQTTFGVIRAAIIEMVVGGWWSVVGGRGRRESYPPSTNHQPPTTVFRIALFPKPAARRFRRTSRRRLFSNSSKTTSSCLRLHTLASGHVRLARPRAAPWPPISRRTSAPSPPPARPIFAESREEAGHASPPPPR